MTRTANNNPETQARTRLQDLRDALLALHKTLLESERAGYEAVFGPVQSTNQLLNLLLNDPWFSWLRHLSALAATIDGALDDKKQAVTPAAANHLIETARTLLRPIETDEASFSKQYIEALQRDPNVVMAHADTTKHLTPIP